ncbi:MAG: elongation factor Ts [Candidatus Taylorbacteria bacterium]|nr:elongation factor Ts [Candidatus Taylorbacteria bacterium]
MFTTEDVKKLRDLTGISIMQCRKALEEADGNFDKATLILRKKGADVAAKKADRALGAGVVASYIHSTGTIGSMVELFCETDFVSGNDEFKKLAYDIAMHVAASNPEFLKAEDITEEARNLAKEVFAKEVEGLPVATNAAQAGKPEAMKAKILEGKMSSYFSERVLLDQPFIKNPEVTIRGLVDGAVHKFGEKVEIGKFVRYSIKR